MPQKDNTVAPRYKRRPCYNEQTFESPAELQYNSEDISDVTNTITQYLWLAKSDQNKRND